jgi:hypothetical protein
MQWKPTRKPWLLDLPLAMGLGLALVLPSLATAQNVKTSQQLPIGRL